MLAELGKVGMANMLDYMKIDESGSPVVDFSKLTRAQAAAIQEITIDDAGGGEGDGKCEAVRRTRIKLWDKLRGLELIGRNLKMFNESSKDDSFRELNITLNIGAGRELPGGRVPVVLDVPSAPALLTENNSPTENDTDEES